MAADSGSALRPGAPFPAEARIGRATTLMGAAMMAMNVLAYAFTLLAAHLLGPSAFGGVSALLGVIIVANVGSLTLQATAARRLATSELEQLPAVCRSVVHIGRSMSLALGLLLLVAVPLLDLTLDLDDWVATSMVAVACAALTMTGAYAGIAQGARRWPALAAIYLSLGLGRILAGGVALAIDPSPRSALIGVAIGSMAPLAIGWRLCPVEDGEESSSRPMIAELWRNGHALLAFFAFTNLDVLLARHFFTHHEAGIYAGGAIIAKSCLFLPTFVLVVAFPSMAADRRGRAWRKPLSVVLGLGGCVVLGTLLLPGLAESFAGGARYVGLGHVAWVFAIEGTLFAGLQILVYDAIAGQMRCAFALWAGVATLALLAALVARPVAGLAALAAATACLVTIAVLALPFVHRPGRVS